MQYKPEEFPRAPMLNLIKVKRNENEIISTAYMAIERERLRHIFPIYWAACPFHSFYSIYLHSDHRNQLNRLNNREYLGLRLQYQWTRHRVFPRCLSAYVCVCLLLTVALNQEHKHTSIDNWHKFLCVLMDQQTLYGRDEIQFNLFYPFLCIRFCLPLL